MRLRVHGQCVVDYEQTAEGDTGTLTIPPGAIHAQAGGDSSTCQPTVELTRERRGTVDPAFGKGGSITALQLRTRQIQSTP
jgi:hypothetical protein